MELGIRFGLSFGLGVRHCNSEPCYLEEKEEEDCLVLMEFTGFMLHLPFCDVLLGDFLEIIMHSDSEESTESKDHLVL